jgi:hypothetical protein
VKEDLDGALKTGRAIGILGAVLGPIVILLLLTTSFLAVLRVATFTLGVVTGVLMPLICGIMFIGLATTICTDKDFDLKCTPSAKGYLLAPASLFWIGGIAFVSNNAVSVMQKRQRSLSRKGKSRLLKIMVITTTLKCREKIFLRRVP